MEKLLQYCMTLHRNIVILNTQLNLSTQFEKMDLTWVDRVKVAYLTYKDVPLIKFEESSSLYHYDPEIEEDELLDRETVTGVIISSMADWNTSMAFLYTQEREVLAFVVALYINIVIEQLLSNTKMEFKSNE